MKSTARSLRHRTDSQPPLPIDALPSKQARIADHIFDLISMSTVRVARSAGRPRNINVNDPSTVIRPSDYGDVQFVDRVDLGRAD